ncbi:D-alanyl-D-alanine carboxypeptidase family protein [Treponema sp. HNW]|uniref:D-alanyl-D-alanine carboxypeptidase family protein n=1 Tax=Treponema sp. HNW TaxID=3116654 RepID=UPI003D0B9BAF
MPKKKSNRIGFLYIKHVFFAFLFIIMVCAVFLAYSVYTLNNPKPASLTADKEKAFQTAAERYRPAPVVPLFWKPEKAGIENIHINAASGILVDIKSGSILYEKNADRIIPPASMTKLAAMYTVFQDIAAGKVSLDDRVPLTKNSWAVNAPPGSSLMFLAEGQSVSLRELLLGLAVVSGNDAATAVAEYIAGSQSAFVERMNAEMKKLGLKHTRFADSSGYSELNSTTAREFAVFSRAYLKLYPESLHEFHSVKEFGYPASNPIIQKNTNPALGIIEGVNGLKTGFIPESGYNLALTAERGSMSILSVTLGGPGKGTKQGNQYRLEDARTLTSYAFDNFQSVAVERGLSVPLGVACGRQRSLFAREAVFSASKEAQQPVIILPASAAELKRGFVLKNKSCLRAPLKAGDIIGKVVYSAGGLTVKEVPLIADRDISEAGFIKKLFDKIACRIMNLAPPDLPADNFS